MRPCVQQGAIGPPAMGGTWRERATNAPPQAYSAALDESNTPPRTTVSRTEFHPTHSREGPRLRLVGRDGRFGVFGLGSSRAIRRLANCLLLRFDSAVAVVAAALGAGNFLVAPDQQK